LEDNIYYSKGVLAKSNAELVERVVRIAGEFGREIANAKEARRIINLPDRQVPRLA
jgi:3-keto-5-aminohexanoate cleavage enzyme